MPRLVLAILVASSILYGGSDVLAMGGGGGRHHGGGGSNPSSSGIHTGTNTSEFNVGGGTTYTTPEPGTIVLLGSGAVGLFLWLRRRK